MAWIAALIIAAAGRLRRDRKVSRYIIQPEDVRPFYSQLRVSMHADSIMLLSLGTPTFTFY